MLDKKIFNAYTKIVKIGGTMPCCKKAKAKKTAKKDKKK